MNDNNDNQFMNAYEIWKQKQENQENNEIKQDNDDIQINKEINPKYAGIEKFNYKMFIFKLIDNILFWFALI